MGLSSRICLFCHNSIRHSGTARGLAGWMQEAVAIKPDGTILTGQYDGYARVSGRDIDGPKENDSPALYHEACYHLAGRPTFDRPSEHADDQGHFLVSEFYPREPRTLGDIQALREHAKKDLATAKARYEAAIARSTKIIVSKCNVPAKRKRVKK